jgi:hypothetical protein
MRGPRPAQTPNGHQAEEGNSMKTSHESIPGSLAADLGAHGRDNLAAAKANLEFLQHSGETCRLSPRIRCVAILGRRDQPDRCRRGILPVSRRGTEGRGIWAGNSSRAMERNRQGRQHANESVLPQNLDYKMPPTIACCCAPPPPWRLHSEPGTRISCVPARRLPENFCYRVPRISYAMWR